MIRVTIWNEFRHEKVDEEVRKNYPDGIHKTISDFLLRDGRFLVKTATLDEPEHGLVKQVLDETDVLLWWGHKAHDEVSDEVAKRVQTRVLEGMGFIGLHSAHMSKPFKYLMGTSCTLKWRRVGEKERLWNIAYSHPITAGIGNFIEIPHSEMYSERFDIPEPDQVLFISWYAGGEVFRSGCVWNRGNGRVFYLSPGDEMYPIYHDKNIQMILVNAVAWTAATVNIPISCPKVEPIEILKLG